MISLESMGRLPSGETVTAATLDDGAGTSIRIGSYGATLTSIRTPDRHGEADEVIVGLDGLAAMLDPAVVAARPCFGATIGRYANRIAGARLVIDGREHRLVANEGGNSLHGGPDGFDRRAWTLDPLPGGDGVRLTLVSPDGDQGFPGSVALASEFRLAAPGELVVRYEATTDRPTHVNIALHPYFNLAGRRSRHVGRHRLRISASRLVAIDGAGLPLPGPLLPLAGTGLDLRDAKPVAGLLASDHRQIVDHGGLNHCFALDDGDGPALRLEDPGSGRVLEMITNAPGIQVYTANAFDGSLRDEAGMPFLRHQAIALEAQHFPDSPHRPDFPATLLRPGELYVSETRFRFTTS
jgi:aldose 1-epimerase